MATELGQAYVQIMPSAKGISGMIQKQIEPESKSAGASAGISLGKSMITAVTAAIAAAGIGKMFAKSISEGAALEQSLGGVETLFKSSADTVKNYANQAYRTAGVSANKYMENVTSFSASLISSLGGDTDKAAELANTAMVDMSDNANKMGTDMESITQTYQSLARGNYAMLDNLKLGYGGTKSEMERLMADAEKLTGEHYTVGDFADTVKAIHAVQDSLGITGTTAEEAATTLSGSLASMKAAFSDFLGKLSLGQDIVPSLNALAETTSTFLFKNFFPMVGNILKGLPTAIGTFISASAPILSQQLGGMFSNIDTNQVMLSFQTMFNNVLIWITANLPTFLAKGVEILTNIGNGILQAIPQLITIAGQIINNFFNFLMTNIPVILEAGKNLLLNLVDGIIANLPAIGNAAIQAVSSFIDVIIQNYPTYISKGYEILGSLIMGIMQRLPDLISAAFSLMTSFITMLLSKLPDLLSTGARLLGSMVSGIINNLPQILSAGSKIMTSLNNGIKSMIGAVLSTVANMINSIIRNVTGIDLSGAGSAIMNGFLGGLQAGFNKVKGFVGGIASWIKEHKGPISYDRKLLIPAGNAIMQGFNEGLNTQFKNVQSNVLGMAGTLSNAFNPDLNAELSAVGDVQLDSSLGNINSFSSDMMKESKLDRIIELLSLISDKDLDILLDGNSIVDKTSKKMSKALDSLNKKAVTSQGRRVAIS
ncbi:phage tail protein [Enterococcus cecorum]|uniref:phage tail protein n=1 Tax=Enterococcus cecorum TaxID=44008 RepID=UPI00148DE247|nr:phage tail protein [Enterococcus cecorum]